jgi:hypothetical protein
MAEKHPYISGSGPIVQIVNHLRKSFPAVVNSETLKKLGIAANNESYLINILRYVGVVDPEGKRTDQAGSVFSQHEDAKFASSLAVMIKNAYKDLFDLHGDDAWKLDLDKLIAFFRSTDQSSAVVGKRQATTFQTLAALSGHAELLSPATTAKSPAAKPSGKQAKVKLPKPLADSPKPKAPSSPAEVGLTVRIEVNLPAEADQETYDRIFRSIRENLINAR